MVDLNLYSNTDSIDISECVQNGIKFCRSQYGADFYHRVNVDRLDMTRSRACVIGQLSGNYILIGDIIGEEFEEYVERFAYLHGFNIHPNDMGDDEIADWAYAELQEEWIHAIAELKENEG